jgi:hypothetical protein
MARNLPGNADMLEAGVVDPTRTARCAFQGRTAMRRGGEIGDGVLCRTARLNELSYDSR